MSMDAQHQRNAGSWLTHPGFDPHYNDRPARHNFP
jgi:hypothetical protein